MIKSNKLKQYIMILLTMVNEFTADFNKATQITVKTVLAVILIAAIALIAGMAIQGAPNLNFG